MLEVAHLDAATPVVSAFNVGRLLIMPVIVLTIIGLIAGKRGTIGDRRRPSPRVQRRGYRSCPPSSRRVGVLMLVGIRTVRTSWKRLLRGSGTPTLCEQRTPVMLRHLVHGMVRR